MTTVQLIGGGRTPAAFPALYGPLLAAAGADPVVACVLIDEGEAAAQFAEWAERLRAVAPCRPVPVAVRIGDTLDAAALDTADAVLVCGGLTPAYQAALTVPLRAYLARRPIPYAGFSAGAAIAARRAVVGGWLADGVPLCPEETGEDLEELEVRDGLGLVDFAVDVHAAQWGTLPRLIEAVARGAAERGVAIDEDTVLSIADGRAEVRGLGRVHLVGRTADAVTLCSYRAGERFPLGVGSPGAAPAPAHS
ncbi:Type 1 glutamine amidotransferase-like domain-containing protein [Kitasatospora sp. NPDC049258]|uniref:Type 1 glutamine amidotransferase-like domain-containing protein n=1 Tax=Kitasatospora sp. NPDC049258 TaxID=3155394 RepID=UPI0034494697